MEVILLKANIDNKETGKNKRIFPIFILPEFQGKDIHRKRSGCVKKCIETEIES